MSVKSYQADHRGGKEGNFLPNFLHSRLIKPFLAPKTFRGLFPSPFFAQRNLDKGTSESFGIALFIMIDCRCGQSPIDLIDRNSDAVLSTAQAALRES